MPRRTRSRWSGTALASVYLVLFPSVGKAEGPGHVVWKLKEAVDALRAATGPEQKVSQIHVGVLATEFEMAGDLRSGNGGGQYRYSHAQHQLERRLRPPGGDAGGSAFILRELDFSTLLDVMGRAQQLFQFEGEIDRFTVERELDFWLFQWGNAHKLMTVIADKEWQVRAARIVLVGQEADRELGDP